MDVFLAAHCLKNVVPNATKTRRNSRVFLFPGNPWIQAFPLVLTVNLGPDLTAFGHDFERFGEVFELFGDVLGGILVAGRGPGPPRGPPRGPRGDFDRFLVPFGGPQNH